MRDVSREQGDNAGSCWGQPVAFQMHAGSLSLGRCAISDSFLPFDHAVSGDCVLAGGGRRLGVRRTVPTPEGRVACAGR